MRKRRDPAGPDSRDAPPEQAAVEQAIRAALARLSPSAGEARPEPPRPGRKPRRSIAPPA